MITELSDKLSQEFGKGFLAANIKQMRTFYLTYSKGQTTSDEFKLSWSKSRAGEIISIFPAHFNADNRPYCSVF